MVGQIVFSLSSISQLDELAEALHQRHYFSFIEDVDAYINKIYNFINATITQPSSHSPEKFQRYGEKYLKYKANSHTTWYIFFDQKGDRFIINYILNNHSQEYPELF